MNLQLFKSLLFIFLLLGGTVNSFGQFIHDRQEGDKPKGKIDSVMVIQYKQYNDEAEIRLDNKTIDVYNKKRQVTESYCFFKPLNADEGPNDKNVRFSKSVFSYDNNGNIMQMINYDIQHKPSYKNIYVYSDSALLVKMRSDFYKPSHYYSGFEPKLIKIKLNKSGKMIEEKSYSDTAGAELKHTRNFSYNSQGYLSQLNATMGKGWAPVKALYNYDSNGNLSKETSLTYHPVNDSIVYRIIYVYTYTNFDKQHNWLIKNEYVKDKLTAVTKRRITYYK